MSPLAPNPGPFVLSRAEQARMTDLMERGEPQPRTASACLRSRPGTDTLEARKLRVVQPRPLSATAQHEVFAVRQQLPAGALFEVEADDETRAYR